MRGFLVAFVVAACAAAAIVFVAYRVAQDRPAPALLLDEEPPAKADPWPPMVLHQGPQLTSTLTPWLTN